jgi:hypothetical protein
MKLFLKIMCAFVIGVATISSIEAGEKSCCSTSMSKVDACNTRSAGCTFLKAAKIALPYLATIGFYKYIYTDEKNAQNKIIELLIGIWVYDHIKQHAKYIEDLVAGVVGDNAPAPAC